MGTSLPTPASPQAFVLAIHRPPEQQPLAQVLPAQQKSPNPPHLAHTPSELLLVQTLPAEHADTAFVDEQQLSPTLPQLAHTLPLHCRPA